MRLAVLTSSRADFGIYLPLLKALKSDTDFSLEVIAFGTHLSEKHGYTIDEITQQGFDVKYRIDSLSENDDALAIATAYGLTAMKFAEFWNDHQCEFDWVFCLGDRYEMAAAVAAGVPFGIKFAHLHGGETTLGAIDNIYRHSITHASTLHFVAAESFKDRVKQLTANEPGQQIVVTGSISLDGLATFSYLSKEAFKERWGIDLNSPSVLITVNPETVSPENNQHFLDETLIALQQLVKDFQLIITLPNADTNGSVFRLGFHKLKERFPDQIHLIESFGKQSYFTAMRYTDLMLGNTSSGIIEAASFGKYVINLGDRQKGRLSGENVLHVGFDSNAIVDAVKSVQGRQFSGDNPYTRGSAVEVIINTLKGQKL